MENIIKLTNIKMLFTLFINIKNKLKEIQAHFHNIKNWEMQKNGLYNEINVAHYHANMTVYRYQVSPRFHATY